MVLEAMKLVPPGIAFRNAANHLRIGREHYPDVTHPNMSHRRAEYRPGDGVVVQIGARQYVNQVVSQALRDGRMREFLVDGVAHLELTGNIGRRPNDPDYGRSIPRNDGVMDMTYRELELQDYFRDDDSDY